MENLVVDRSAADNSEFAAGCICFLAVLARLGCTISENAGQLLIQWPNNPLPCKITSVFVGKQHVIR